MKIKKQLQLEVVLQIITYKKIIIQNKNKKDDREVYDLLKKLDRKICKNEEYEEGDVDNSYEITYVDWKKIDTKETPDFEL